jgi:hypothetical protein
MVTWLSVEDELNEIAAIHRSEVASEAKLNEERSISRQKLPLVIFGQANEISGGGQCYDFKTVAP